jgi:hypothetical protein
MRDWDGWICVPGTRNPHGTCSNTEGGKVMEGSNPDDVISSQGTAPDNSHAKLRQGEERPE